MEARSRTSRRTTPSPARSRRSPLIPSMPTSSSSGRRWRRVADDRRWRHRTPLTDQFPSLSIGDHDQPARRGRQSRPGHAARSAGRLRGDGWLQQFEPERREHRPPALRRRRRHVVAERRARARRPRDHVGRTDAHEGRRPALGARPDRRRNAQATRRPVPQRRRWRVVHEHLRAERLRHRQPDDLLRRQLGLDRPGTTLSAVGGSPTAFREVREIVVSGAGPNDGDLQDRRSQLPRPDGPRPGSGPVSRRRAGGPRASRSRWRAPRSTRSRPETHDRVRRDESDAQRNTGSWIADGFRRAARILVSNAGLNDGSYTIEGLSRRC